MRKDMVVTMKNDLPARAMTYIDDALIEEADVGTIQVRRTVNVKKMFLQFGSLAACAVIAVGVFLVSLMGSSQVSFYGEAMKDGVSMTANANLPRMASATEQTEPIELKLSFKKPTEISVDGIEMTVCTENGEELFRGTKYTATGTVLISLMPQDAETIIVTDKGYSLLVKFDGPQTWTITKISQK